MEESSTKILKKGQLIISARGTVGEIGQVTKDMAFNQSCYGLEGGENFNNNFLYYLLKKKIKDIQGKGHGAVFNTITKETFNQIIIALPPLQEQTTIAQILSSLDEKIELNNKMNKTLEAIGQAIFKKWFVDGKKEEWEISIIGKELKTILGGTPSRTKSEYWDGDINWINSGAINNFPLINPTEKISELGLNNSATQLMPRKTIVLPFVISVGKSVSMSILGTESAGNQSVLGIVPNEKFSSSFIYYYIQNKKKEIYSSVTGGAQQHINKRNVDETTIIIPNEEILTKFDLLVEPLINLILKNALQNQTLSQIRDALLPKLMSGEVRIK